MGKFWYFCCDSFDDMCVTNFGIISSDEWDDVSFFEGSRSLHLCLVKCLLYQVFGGTHSVTASFLVLQGGISCFQDLLNEAFGGVVGVYLGPLVNNETYLCAKEKDERLRSLADGKGVVAGRAGCGSFFGSGSSGC